MYNEVVFNVLNAAKGFLQLEFLLKYQFVSIWGTDVHLSMWDFSTLFICSNNLLMPHDSLHILDVTEITLLIYWCLRVVEYEPVIVTASMGPIPSKWPWIAFSIPGSIFDCLKWKLYNLELPEIPLKHAKYNTPLRLTRSSCFTIAQSCNVELKRLKTEDQFLNIRSATIRGFNYSRPFYICSRS